MGLGGLDNNHFWRRRGCLTVLAAMSEASELERKVERLKQEIEREVYDRLHNGLFFIVTILIIKSLIQTSYEPSRC